MNQVVWNEHFSVEELVDFSEKNPWLPQFPATLIRRFVNEMISSRKYIFDLHDRFGRVSAAVLLDRVTNPSNDACLEVLGMRSGADVKLVYSQFIELAKQFLPTHRLGFQIGANDNSEIKADFFQAQGLVPCFETYEMYAAELSRKNFQTHAAIRAAVLKDKDQIFQVLCEAFAENLDTSIPDFDIWSQGFLQSMGSYFYVWQENSKILGFANLIRLEGDLPESEIRTLGVSSAFQGNGIGRHLLEHCLLQSQKWGAINCHLTVAVANERALGLYLRSGFESKDKFICYHTSRN